SANVAPWRATQTGRTTCLPSTRAGLSRGWRSGLVPRRPGHWIAAVRLALAILALVVVAITSFPPGYEAWAWGGAAFFAASAVFSAYPTLVGLDRTGRVRARALAVVLDGIAAVGFVAVFSYQSGEPYRALYLIPIAEAALRFGFLAGVLSGVVMTSATIVIDALGPGTAWRAGLVRVAVGLFAGAVIGRLSDDLGIERRAAEARAREAEGLRDELGRRVDLLEAANRCSRALASSLDLGEAFGAFIRELRGLVPFDRCAIVLAEGGVARIMATAGEGAETTF